MRSSVGGPLLRWFVLSGREGEGRQGGGKLTVTHGADRGVRSVGALERSLGIRLDRGNHSRVVVQQVALDAAKGRDEGRL